VYKNLKIGLGDVFSGDRGATWSIEEERSPNQKSKK
jgi:hypothetical protein